MALKWDVMFFVDGRDICRLESEASIIIRSGRMKWPCENLRHVVQYKVIASIIEQGLGHTFSLFLCKLKTIMK